MQKSVSSQAKTNEPRRVGTNGETRTRVDFLPLSPTHVREDASELTSFVDAYSSFLVEFWPRMNLIMGSINS